MCQCRRIDAWPDGPIKPSGGPARIALFLEHQATHALVKANDKSRESVPRESGRKLSTKRRGQAGTKGGNELGTTDRQLGMKGDSGRGRVKVGGGPRALAGYGA